MEKTLLNRWSPILLKNKTLRNRVVIPPMASETADTQGYVTPKTIEHYQRLAQAGPGLLIVEYTYVHSTGRSEINQLGIQSDEHVEGLRKLAGLIKKSGALAGIQLSHGGGKSDRDLTGGVLWGPSTIAVPVKGLELETPDRMSKEEIEIWKNSFLKAAERAVLSGFDLIELHSAHGYGLNQWLSPITNQRDDEYGQDLFGRMKLLLEIVFLIREKFPQLIISVRMPGQDFSEGGLNTIDGIQIAQSLELAGVDLIHVSSGIGGWRRTGARIGEGYLVDEAAKIQAAISIPVIGVGGISSGEYIDQGLATGQFSLAAVGRAILENPKNWHDLVLAN